MRTSTCLIVAILFVSAAAALYLTSLNEQAMRHILPLTAEFLRSAAALSMQGAVAFLALAVFVGAKVTTEETARSNARLKHEVLSELFKTISPARRGIESLHRIQTSDGRRLPTEGVDSFDDVASFCAAWRKPERLLRLDTEDKDLLLEANEALFAFVIELEVRKSVPPNIDQRMRVALEKLDLIELAVRQKIT